MKAGSGLQFATLVHHGGNTKPENYLLGRNHTNYKSKNDRWQATFNKKILSWDTEIRVSKRMLVLLGVILVIPIAFFSFNGSYKNISTNSYNNQLAGNGLYELFSAFRNNELDYEQFYKTLPEEQVEKNMRALLTTPDAKMLSSAPWDYTRQVTGQTNGKKPNVVFHTL